MLAYIKLGRMHHMSQNFVMLITVIVPTFNVAELRHHYPLPSNVSR